jgi:hypothetical protein
MQKYLVEKYATKLGNLIHYLRKLWIEDPDARIIIFSQVCENKNSGCGVISYFYFSILPFWKQYGMFSPTMTLKAPLWKGIYIFSSSLFVFYFKFNCSLDLSRDEKER